MQRILFITLLFFALSGGSYANTTNWIGGNNPVYDPRTPQYPVSNPNFTPPMQNTDGPPQYKGPQDNSGTLKNPSLAPMNTIQAKPINLNNR